MKDLPGGKSFDILERNPYLFLHLRDLFLGDFCGLFRTLLYTAAKKETTPD
jgi:hypothetical protein